MTLVVGLTGNIASGKTSVATLLAAKGATVINADVLARDAIAPGTSALAAIRERWPAVVSPEGVLDRPALRSIVFRDAAARAALNAIVHPQVARLFREQVAAARSRGDHVVVYDVPLLFEAGRTGDVDVVVLVDAPEAVRRERIVAGRGLSADEADAMIAAQMPATIKRSRAHHVIENDGDRAALAARVDELWNALAPRGTPG